MITAMALAYSKSFTKKYKPRDSKGKFTAYKNKSLVERMIPIQDEWNLAMLKSQVQQLKQQEEWKHKHLSQQLKEQ